MIAYEEITLQKTQKIETFTATAAQNVYTLSETPRGDVVFTRNGQTLPTPAYSVSANQVTFIPSGTGSNINAVDASDSSIQAGDIITIIYFYEVQ